MDSSAASVMQQMRPSVAARGWQRVFCHWWPWPLTFDLDIQTRPSNGLNTSSLWIWRKPVQPFLRHLSDKQKKTKKKAQIACGKNGAGGGGGDRRTTQRSLQLGPWRRIGTNKRNNYVFIAAFLPPVLWHCWLGVKKSIQPVKKLNDEMLAYLSI